MSIPRDPLNPKKPLAWDPSSPPKFQIYEFTVSGRDYQGNVVSSFHRDLITPKKNVKSPSQDWADFLSFAREIDDNVRQYNLKRKNTKLRNRKKRISSRVRRPPGYLLYSIAEFVFKKKTLELVVEPILSDLQNDYFTALSQGRTWQATWIRVRDSIGLFKAVGFSTLVQLIQDLFRFAK